MANGDITAADQDDFDNASAPAVPGKPKPGGFGGKKGFIETAKGGGVGGKKVPTGKPANPAKKAQFKARMKAISGRRKNAAAKKAMF